MSKVNQVRLVGYLGQDPEKRSGNSGNEIVSFSMSTTERYRDQEGIQRERTDWHNVIAFGAVGKVIHAHLKKGAQVMVDGRLSHRTYEDKNGVTRYISEVICEDVLFLSKSKNA